MFGSLSLQWIKDGSPNEARVYAELATREAKRAINSADREATSAT